MGPIIMLIIWLAIIAIAWWAITQLSLPPPVRMVAVIIVALLAIAILLDLSPSLVTGNHLLWRGCP